MKVRMLSGAAGRTADGKVYVLRVGDVTDVAPETARAWERMRAAAPIEAEVATTPRAERAVRRPARMGR